MSPPDPAESGNFLRGTLDALTQHIAVLDADGVIIAVNRAWQQFGEANGLCVPDHALGSNYLAVCEKAAENGSDTAQAMARAIRDIRDGRSDEFSIEYDCHGPDEQRWFIARLTRFPEPGPLRIVVTHETITERRLAEEALLTSTARVRAILDASADGFVTLSEGGLIESVNPRLEQMCGWRADALVGRPIDVLVTLAPDGQGEAGLENLLPADHPGAPAHAAESIARREDGTTFPVEIAISETYFDEARHFVVSIHDISARKELAARLLHAQKMEALGRLAGGIAHDFNNLLGAIRGSSELLREKLPPGSSGRRAADRIHAAADRGTALTRHLLGFSRRQPAEPQRLDLNAAITSTLELVEHMLGENVHVERALTPSLCRIWTDPMQIEQIVMNLLLNARDAMPRGGSVVLETSSTDLDARRAKKLSLAPGCYVRLRVRDTGEGMDEETRARIFEPFFTTKPQGRGTGLGLSMVYGSIQQAGGAIRVESAPGEGTLFEIHLPCIHGARAGAGKAEAAVDAAGRATKILLVEDDEHLRGLVSELLEASGYTVLVAALPEDALQLAREHLGSIDLLVTDMVMPGMTGLDLAERLHRENPGLGVLFVSGYTEAALGGHGVLGPGAAFIRKPFSNETLRRRVREILERTRPD